MKFLLFPVIVFVCLLMPAANTGARSVCTSEAKLCPDGSSVGRASPDCEFAPCPGEDLPAEPAPGDSSFEQDVAGSGITGEVVLGPQCPVIGPGMGEQCADKGYQTRLVVRTTTAGQTAERRRAEEGREVARVQSGVDGRFRVVLAPGEYIVVPLPGAGSYPICRMQTVTVEPGRFTPLTVRCDTGIR